MGICDICDLISVRQLQDILRSHNLPISGSKSILIGRLYEHSKAVKHPRHIKQSEPKSHVAAKRASKRIHIESGDYVPREYAPDAMYTFGNNSIHITSDNIKLYFGKKLGATIHKYVGYWLNDYMLVKLAKHEYVYIGPIIYTFKTKDEIVNYITGDGMYPIAFGTENVYFMLDQKYLPINKFRTRVSTANSESLYSEFYGDLYPEKYVAPKNMSSLKNLR